MQKNKTKTKVRINISTFTYVDIYTRERKGYAAMESILTIKVRKRRKQHITALSIHRQDIDERIQYHALTLNVERPFVFDDEVFDSWILGFARYQLTVILNSGRILHYADYLVIGVRELMNKQKPQKVEVFKN